MTDTLQTDEGVKAIAEAIVRGPMVGLLLVQILELVAIIWGIVAWCGL